MKYRQQIIERDEAQISRPSSSETLGMVVTSPRGVSTPRLFTSGDEIINFCGNPSVDNPSLFDALAGVSSAPVWLVSAIGDNARTGGVFVKNDGLSSFSSFGITTETLDFSALDVGASSVEGTGDGLIKTFTGTLGNTPIKEGTFKVSVGGRELSITELGGSLSGSDVVTGTLDKASGVYSFELAGVEGSVAFFDTDINLTGGIDLSIGSVDKLINLNIDGEVYENINLGQSATTSRADIITAINTAVGSVVAEVKDDGGEFIRISGSIGDFNLGRVVILNPTTGESALNLVFSALGVSPVQGILSTSPTGAIPKNGESVLVQYVYTVDGSTDYSFALVTTAPCNDYLSAEITYLGGTQFSMILSEILPTGKRMLNATPLVFSLQREMNNFSQSLYFEDVLKNNPYVKIIKNKDFTDTITFTTDEAVFVGGNRGDYPTDSQINNTWDVFKKANKYKCRTLVDCFGVSAVKINNLVTDFQYPWGHAISCIPFGEGEALDAIAYRQSTGIGSDRISFYSNWAKIVDDYNSSEAWISDMGSVARRYADKEQGFDGGSPAGDDDFGVLNEGGVLQFWRYIEREVDYSENDFRLLDEAQINPIIVDEGTHKIYGDKTALTYLTDTSFVSTRRVYNIILESVTRQVLKRQEFKVNTRETRDRARFLTEAILNPILNVGAIREFQVICDERNNTDDVLNRNEFVLSIFIKATSKSQKVILELVRVAQNRVIADFTPA